MTKAKSVSEIAAEKVHATFHWMNQTEVSELMSATFKLIQIYVPALSVNRAMNFTINLIKPVEAFQETQKHFKDSFKILLDAAKKGRFITFESQITLSVWNNYWDSDDRFIYPFDETTVMILPDLELPLFPGQEYLEKYYEAAEKMRVPMLMKALFLALSKFPFDSVANCKECGIFFFDERGYKRQFCSKKCNDRYAARKSRAKAKGGST